MSGKMMQNTIASKTQKRLIWLKMFYFFSSLVGLFFFSFSFAQVGEATIIDNTDPGFTLKGNWTSSSSLSGFYGSNYLYTGGGTGSKTATWTFQISTPGRYDISARWVQSSNRAANAPYTIKNNGVNLGTVLVDQRINGGQFNVIGTYTLNAGTLEVVLNNFASGRVIADAVQVSSFLKGVRIVSPSNLDLKTSQVLIEALAVGFPSNWGVEFIVEEAGSGNIIKRVKDYNFPFKQLVTLSPAEYTVEARAVDGSGNPQPFSDNVEFGVGDYYAGFGDSITKGGQDNVKFDNWSNDFRNGGGGYEPVLNNLLTNNKGYPHTVKNEGVGGKSSIDGVNLISSVLSAHPEAQYVINQFGTNDASNMPPTLSGKGLKPGNSGYAGSFKDNMQQIITAIIQAGKTPLLAKVPILYASCGSSEPFPNPDEAPQNMLIQEYNVVIDELRLANGITVIAPDFYNYFRAHPEELADFCHPNGVGYQSMAKLWCNALTGTQCSN